MRRLRLLGNALTVLGILVVFSSSVLPMVRLPQTLIRTGPNVTPGTVNEYWIDTFILPTIDAETPVLVDLRESARGGLGITIIPYRDGAPVMGAPPLFTHLFDEGESTYSVEAATRIQAEYFVSVFSEMNAYTLTISSVWSPYDSLRPYLYLGLVTIAAGLVLIYYDRILEKRDREILEATR
jgi:uncharacterized protein YjeT (DUF2065 family)